MWSGVDPARASLLVADAFMIARTALDQRSARAATTTRGPREFFRLWTRREALLKAQRHRLEFDESSRQQMPGRAVRRAGGQRSCLLARHHVRLQSRARATPVAVLSCSSIPVYVKGSADAQRKSDRGGER